MATPRVGALGVGTTKGDLYVVDVNGELERIGVGADGQVLTADSTDPTLGLVWAPVSAAVRATVMCDAVDAIFKKITLGGLKPNPQTKTRGTHSVLSYDDTIVQGIAWQRAMPNVYDTTRTLNVNIYWVAATAIADDVIWAAAFERDDAATPRNILTDGFAALQTGAATTAPGVLGDIAVTTIPFTNAQADGILAGEPFRLFVQRTATSVADTMVGDAQIVRVVISES
jgi:hypothetical protein